METLEVSVVICTYTIDRWEQLVAAVNSVLDQRRAVQGVIVVVDHNAELLSHAQSFWQSSSATSPPHPAVQVVASTGARGLSGARNTGIAVATSEIVAFLDDDAHADPSWSEWLLVPYADQDVMACGGAAEAEFDGPRPPWWPLEFDWVVGCSYLGLPRSQADVRNLIGANMSLRRRAAVEVGGFAEGIGRVGTRPLGCEETDLFIRMAWRSPRARIVYEPQALVHHRVPPARLSWRYFRARCFSEGLSKAKVASRLGSNRALAAERSYVRRVLPQGMARGFRGGWQGEEGAVAQALAIGAGLLVTTAGYASGRAVGAARSPFSQDKRVVA